ncbi:MAG: DUF4416 family protein [Gemmataceae bacterium]
MAEPRIPDPVLLVVAAFSRHRSALEWAQQRLQDAYGPIDLVSLPYRFVQTTYYQAEMGRELCKGFQVFRHLQAADCLPIIKLHTNELERQLAELGRYPEPRPLNLDPGILTLGKFMLATTKDQAHRLYLGQGIHAEVTLRYQEGTFHPWPWTYADYRLPNVLAFLQEARNYYKQRLRDWRTRGEVT